MNSSSIEFQLSKRLLHLFDTRDEFLPTFPLRKTRCIIKVISPTLHVATLERALNVSFICEQRCNK